MTKNQNNHLRSSLNCKQKQTTKWNQENDAWKKWECQQRATSKKKKELLELKNTIT